MLIKELKEYEKTFTDMTREEKHLLHMWVRNGNSPYDNGDYVCDDSGYPMDYVSTLRFWADIQEYYDSLSEEEQREFRGETVHEPIEIPERSDDVFFIPEDLKKKVESEVLL
jgi:hypothetical protein